MDKKLTVMLKGNWTNEGTLGAAETHYMYAKFDCDTIVLSGIINSRNLATNFNITLLFKGNFKNGIGILFFYKTITDVRSVAEAKIRYVDENNLIWEIVKDENSFFSNKTILSATSFNFG